jgi:hypothetical protein
VSYTFYVVATSNVGNVQVNAQASAISATAVNMAAIEYWRLLNYHTTANAGVAADTATPVNDGLVNLVKYGLDLPTSTAGNGYLPAAHVVAYADGTRLAMDFYRDPSHNDVTLQVQAADSPQGPWTTVATSVNGAPFSGAGFVSETSTNGALIAVEVRDTVNLSSTTRRFMRAVVVH